jgi:hypothetical protein
VNGAADYITGTHVWFPENQALAFVDEGVMAFHITDSGNRFNGCYIDGSRAVFEGSGLRNNVWTNGFECCAGVAGVAHGIELRGDAVGPGLVIAHNEFGGGNIFSTPATPGAAVAVRGVKIADNSFSHGGAGSRATATLAQVAATQWAFDLCAQLVFPVISRVTVSVQAAAGFPVAIARPAVGCTVLVETSEAVTGNVTVLVESGELDANFV